MRPWNESLAIVGTALLVAGVLGHVEPLAIIGVVWMLMSTTEEIGLFFQRRQQDREALDEYRRNRRDR